MQLTTFLASAALSTLAAAAPAVPLSSSTEVSARGVGDTWTLLDMKRVCNDADTECQFIFGIDAAVSYPASADRFPMSCTHTVYSPAAGVPASQHPGTPVTKCQWFSVTTGWNAGGWTTMSVFDTPKDWIAYFGYQNAQLATEQVVEPDVSETVENIP